MNDSTIARVRMVSAVTASFVALAMISCAWLREREPHVSAGIQPGDGRARTESDGVAHHPDAGAVISWSDGVAERASSRWIELGMPAGRAKALEDDLRIVLRSIFTPDYSAYHKWMTQRGLSLDEVADGFLDAMLEWAVYERDVPTLTPDLPIERRIAYLWNTPERRGARWRAVDLGTVEAGFGLATRANSPTWPYPGAYALLSLYAPPHGRLTEAQGHTLDRSPDSAWVMVAGSFMGGMTTRVRLNWYFDDRLGTWLPVTIMFGTDGDFRPFPII